MPGKTRTFGHHDALSLERLGPDGGNENASRSWVDVTNMDTAKHANGQLRPWLVLVSPPPWGHVLSHPVRGLAQRGGARRLVAMRGNTEVPRVARFHGTRLQVRRPQQRMWLVLLGAWCWKVAKPYPPTIAAEARASSRMGPGKIPRRSVPAAARSSAMLRAKDGLVAIPPAGTSRMYIAVTTRM
jgi:hypothetical protein